MEKNSPMNDEEITKSKIDWSTPCDEWLIPLLNRARHCGPIEFRSLPSIVQLEIEKAQASRDQQIALAAKLDVLKKVGQAYHSSEYQDKSREALSMALWAEIRALEQEQKGKWSTNLKAS